MGRNGATDLLLEAAEIIFLQIFLGFGYASYKSYEKICYILVYRYIHYIYW